MALVRHEIWRHKRAKVTENAAGHCKLEEGVSTIGETMAYPAVLEVMLHEGREMVHAPLFLQVKRWLGIKPHPHDVYVLARVGIDSMRLGLADAILNILRVRPILQEEQPLASLGDLIWDILGTGDTFAD